VNDATQALLPGVSPILKSTFGLSYFQLGTLFGAFLLAMVFFQVVVGWLADRSDELDLMAIGTFLVFCACVGFALSSLFYQLFIFNVIAGIGASFYHPSAYTVLSRAANDTVRRSKIMGFSGSSGDVGNFIAFLSTGALALTFGWEAPFMIWGSLSLLMLVSYLLVFRQRLKVLRTQTIPQEIALPQHAARFHRGQLIFFLMAYFTLGGAYRTFVNFSTLFITEKANLTADYAGILFSVFIVAGATGSVVSGFLNEKFGMQRTQIAEYLIVATLFFSLTRPFIQKSPLLLIIIYFFSGIMLFAIYPTIYSIASRHSRSVKRGQFYGRIMALSFFGGFAISFLDGKLADIYGITIVYVVGTLICLIGALSAYQLSEKTS